MDTLIFNPNAGTAQRLGLTSEHLLRALNNMGIFATIPHEQMTPDEILEAAKNTSGRVIVAGGDGTIHSVLKSVNTYPSLQLAIIPIGTANHFADALGIPDDINAAIETIANGQVKQVDLGVVNGIIFTQAAGAGLHARAFHVYGERDTKSIKDTAAVALEMVSGLEPKLMKVTIDEIEIYDEITMVTAANTSSYGRLFTIAPDAKLDDGLLDVVILERLNKLELVEYAIAAMNGTLVNLPKAHIYRGQKILIESVGTEPIEIHADAAPAGHTPALIEVLPKCLNVIVPKEAG